MTVPEKNLYKSSKLEKTLIHYSQVYLRLANINVRTLVGRSAEVTETVGRRVDVVALQEVHYQNKGVKTLQGGDFEYRLHWKGEDTANGGVRLMVKCELVIVGDFNSLIDENEGIHKGQGWRIPYKQGDRLLELANSFNVVVGNTFFKTQKN